MYTPMLKQYLRIKQKYKDCVLFFRLGDFYEMFFDDAKKASKILDIVLTSRNAGDGNKAPMCGVPFHSADNYIYKLIENGEKVAICEQVEDASESKGLVKREVIRVITPGTMTDSNFLKPDANNFLFSYIVSSNEVGYSYLDISTGYFKFGTYVGNDKLRNLEDKIKRLTPSEIITDNSLQNIVLRNENIHINIIKSLTKELESEINFNIKTTNQVTKKAIMLMLEYIYLNQKGLLKRLTNISYDNETEHMLLDNTTIDNLELVETLRDKKKYGSLFYHLDQTKTSMGSRKIKNWLLNPLVNIDKIEKRQEVIDLLLENNELINDIESLMSPIIDIERLIAKLATYNANGKDLRALANSLINSSKIYRLINNIDLALISSIANPLEKAASLAKFIDNAVTDDPPTSVREGDLIKTGFREKVDKLRTAKEAGEEWISKLEISERKRTGIKNLKVGYNKVFGYYLEVTKSNIKNVPNNYTRKQTLTNSERYFTPELKEKEEEILTAQEKLYDLEYEIFQEIIYELLKDVNILQLIADAVAILDSLYSLAIIANRNNYIKPSLVNNKIIDIKDGRHPVVEKVIRKNDDFIPNDIYMDDTSIFHIITGPNMSGKSTFMRQVALIIILAQIGSYVPASKAVIGLTDRVFTRVGASDDIFSGQSTFMVEMNEVANICKNATENSFVILDEIGRGTSTYDGMSIARAVSEYLLNINCRSLFATHYHELTDLADKYSNIKNYSVAVYDDGDDIVFLYKMVQKASNRSYGIHVCKLAGIPEEVIEKAEKYLEEMQNRNVNIKEAKPKYNQLKIDTIALNKKDSKILKQIQNININTITPLDAITIINKWQNELNEESVLND